MKLKLLAVSLWCCVSAQAEEAQTAPAIPGSEILLFDIKVDQTGWLSLSAGKNISNHPGYDSQPKFSTAGDTIYYTHADNQQMDIYQYDIKSGQSSPYLTTAESEYSPTPVPGKTGLSVVQVDAKGDQYVVFLNNQGKPVEQAHRFSDLKQVGYFNWTAQQGLWSFVLNDNNGGDLYYQSKGQPAQKIDAHVGRSFITDPDHKKLFYVDKNSSPWRIKSRHDITADAEDIMALPMGVEDFTLDAKGRFWAGRDNTLYVSTDQRRWYIVTEFNDPKFHQITRLTTNPAANKIAIVFAEKKPNE